MALRDPASRPGARAAGYNGGICVKLLIIGLDGATFDLIEPWVAEGILPNIGGLMKSGVYGALESTIPPITPNAWSTFMTGKNAVPRYRLAQGHSSSRGGRTLSANDASTAPRRLEFSRATLRDIVFAPPAYPGFSDSTGSSSQPHTGQIW